MKIKKYVASSMTEAMRHIRAELGSEAVILNSREVKSNGFLGFFKKRSIEILAAVDHLTEPQVKTMTKQVSANGNKKDHNFQQGTKRDSPHINSSVLKEFNDLKSNINSLSNQNPVYPEQIKLMQQILMEQDICDSERNKLLTSLLRKWYLTGESASIHEVYSWLEKEMVLQLEGIDFGGITFKKRYVNVVGPTGVGKTTTLAKIAAECVIKQNKKIAFITTDTYRIAAIEQLKTYAKILNIPIEVCYTLDDFKKAANTFIEYDLILIDTAGRNFRNKEYVEDLKKIIDFNCDIETFLVLSLTSKQRDMEDIYSQFSNIEIDKFIFTKSDETSSYGAMYNLIVKFNKGVAYMTNGQNVPDDIIELKPSVIAKTIIGVE